MMKGMFSATTGMVAQQQQIDVISNNMGTTFKFTMIK